jgi:D-hydroxyproline dehydrogenase subunit gamma
VIVDANTLRVDGIDRGSPVSFTLNGRVVQAYAGESVAAALFSQGVRTLRHSPSTNLPRGMFCLMGSCQECLVWVESRKQPSCQLPVSQGLTVETLDYREAQHE